jgi:cell division protein FtsB
MDAKSNLLFSLISKYKITKNQFLIYCIGISLIIYFIFASIFSQKGLLELFKLKQQVQNKDFAKKELISKMKLKKSMVEGMNIDSLDLDLVDEQSRRVLGYVGKNEVVIYQDQNQKEYESTR